MGFPAHQSHFSGFFTISFIYEWVCDIWHEKPIKRMFYFNFHHFELQGFGGDQNIGFD